jgi:FkbM family methyltransferase
MVLEMPKVSRMAKIYDRFKRFILLFYYSRTRINYLIFSINKQFHKSYGIEKEQIFLMPDGVKIFTGLKSGAGIGQIYLDSIYSICKEFDPTDNSVVIDVGAFVGTFSLKTSVKNKTVKVIAIEPSERNFALLEKNVRINCLRNILPVKYAVSDFDGESILYISTKDPSLDSIERKVSKDSVLVPVYKLDTLVNELDVDPNKVSIIKIDAEGSEMKILKGAKQLLRSGNTKFIIAAEHTPNEDKVVSSFLGKIGFKTCIFRLKQEVQRFYNARSFDVFSQIM